MTLSKCLAYAVGYVTDSLSIRRAGVLRGAGAAVLLLPLLSGRKPKPKIPKITKYKSELFEAAQVKLGSA